MSECVFNIREIVKEEVDKYLEESGFPVKKEDKQNKDVYIIQRPPCIDNESNSIVRPIFVNKYFNSEEEAKKYIRTIPNYDSGIFIISKLSEYTEEKVGFKDDELFLLSIEEYEKYKNVIPKINCWWMLRSPGNYLDAAAHVNNDGSVNNYGGNVNFSSGAVRPALKIPNINISNLKVGDRFIKYNFPWIIIDTDLAIAEVPISFNRFDEALNYYETSEVRKFLKNWAKERDLYII